MIALRIALVVVALSPLAGCEASEPEPRVLPVVVDASAARTFVTDCSSPTRV